MLANHLCVQGALACVGRGEGLAGGVRVGLRGGGFLEEGSGLVRVGRLRALPQAYSRTEWWGQEVEKRRGTDG